MIREFVSNDLQALTDICSKAMTLEPHDWSEALVREKTIGALDFEPALALGFESNGEIRGFLQATRGPHPDSGKAWIRLMAVNPAWQAQGIGTALLGELERRLRDLGTARLQVMDSPVNYLTPGVDFRATSAVCFLTQHGFGITHTNLNLMCDLTSDDFEDCDGAIVEAARKGVDVRRAEESDRDAIVAWTRREFPDWEGELLACFRQSPISLWIAVEGSEVLGFGAYDSNNINTGHFGPTGLSPAARGKGLGALLTRVALRDQRRQGHPLAVIPWVGPIRFYSKCCGAWTDRVFYSFAKSLA